MNKKVTVELRTQYFGSNPVRYMRDKDGLDWVCVQDMRAATDPASLLEVESSDTVN